MTVNNRQERATAAFAYGQPVEIAPGSRTAGDWNGVALWVAGITYDPRTKAPDYWLSEHWPPNGLGDMTDGFSENMLVARSAR